MTPGITPLTRDKVLGCVLAGGQSRRMGGGDKTLLDLNGKPMLEIIFDRLSPQVPQIVLNANGDANRFSRFPFPVVSDSIAGFAGPLAGILAGLDYARENLPDVSHVISVAGDTPFFPVDLVDRFLATTPADKPVIALASSADKLQPVFGLWPVALAEDLHDWLAKGQSGKVLAFVDRHDSIEVAFELDQATGLDPFFNANRPDDLETARSAASLLTS
ncbi:molybdenum cofactor guanylyltransferase MobA [Labrenzia sp. PHM005]|uniref:molybdenum cofactor guanylyltransferase MobA n=1 Tax=Labrenzia sp. PHM005 TaxID=2590016 RepID=UPI00114088A5|nr:molybdenum cofactor guanylyltransferase MobA [Labrenzia sp. PHM005]QDG77904.1 molybdenum cofactor guanylyltransferase MobA [Labrenzia sp. PHM005]